MASKAELLASARKKGQKQDIFRRGRGTTTNVRQVGVDKSAGRDAKAVSEFLGTMLKFGPGVQDALNKEKNEENKKMVESGEAAYKNATPAQRKQFRDNIRNGTISGGESPYFREGLRRSQADAMSLEYGVAAMDAWNKSDVKNNPDPEAFNKWLEDFHWKADGPPGMNRSWTERVGDLGDHVANEEFWPKADAIKRQLMGMHSDHQRIEYDKKARDTKDSSEHSKTLDSNLTLSIEDVSVSDRKLFEKQNESVINKLLNVVTTAKSGKDADRKLVWGDIKPEFVANEILKGKTKLQAETAWQNQSDLITSNIRRNLEDFAGGSQGYHNLYHETRGIFSEKALKTEDKKAAKENVVQQKEDRNPTSGKKLRKLYTKRSKVIVKESELHVEVAENQELGLEEFVVETEVPSSLAQEVVATPIVVTKPEPEPEPEPEPKPKPVKIKPVIAEAIQEAVAEVKEVEGIDPLRVHYGVVAYRTEGEAEKIVDRIQRKVIKKETGSWDIAIIKVGELYQVQTQGGTNVTKEQKDIFFNALSSEFSGQMGNINAERGAKDWVQTIQPKKEK